MTGRQGARTAGANPRAKRANPRAKGANPRAAGANPAAVFGSDAARVARMRRAALARHRVTVGPWCRACDDTGLTYTDAGDGMPCGAHVPMTAADAYLILHPPPD